jgi:hypothetical protein
MDRWFIVIGAGLLNVAASEVWCADRPGVLWRWIDVVWSTDRAVMRIEFHDFG